MTPVSQAALVTMLPPDHCRCNQLKGEGRTTWRRILLHSRLQSRNPSEKKILVLLEARFFFCCSLNQCLFDSTSSFTLFTCFCLAVLPPLLQPTRHSKEQGLRPMSLKGNGIPPFITDNWKMQLNDVFFLEAFLDCLALFWNGILLQS